MPSPNEKLAESLSILGEVQAGGRRVFRSRDLSRTHRERLLRNGFLKEVVKGWLISWSPSAKDGESTPWYASFWEFCVRYCHGRFGAAWHLSPEQSVLYSVSIKHMHINRPPKPRTFSTGERQDRH
jgi:hypothetical protein